MEETLGYQQAEFRKNKSTIDQMHVLRRITEKFCEYNKEIHCLFIDVKKAYDSIQRSSLWIQMEKVGIPEKVGVNGKLSAYFEVKTRYPLLFNLDLEKSIKRVAEMETDLQIGRKVNILAYTDDTVLVKEINEVGLEIDIEEINLPISRCHNVGPRAIDMDGEASEKYKILNTLEHC
ncbi:hypothetical protein PR048_019972 [Dryococelus australis]|uniref:Reverse transcriptase domain-containing protein n=1 Tax=Dryococelus australis TaxID=614101 RepID=A0ABQ9H4Z2_9NEOP|nr:hypothetical protein PR048_019972 [Dryococelus australis]